MVQTRSRNYNSIVYYKVTNLNENHHGFQYKDGLNILNRSFDTEGACAKGGLYFSDIHNIHRFASYGCWLREITIPDDAQVVVISQNNTRKYRADKLILGKRIPLYSLDALEILNLTPNETIGLFNEGLIHSCIYGNLELAKLCVSYGADEFGLCSTYACEYGHIDLAKLCVAHGANDLRLGLKYACENGHLDLVDFCMSQEAPCCSCSMCLSITEECDTVENNVSHLEVMAAHTLLDLFQNPVESALEYCQQFTYVSETNEQSDFKTKHHHV